MPFGVPPSGGLVEGALHGFPNGTNTGQPMMNDHANYSGPEPGSRVNYTRKDLPRLALDQDGRAGEEDATCLSSDPWLRPLSNTADVD